MKHMQVRHCSSAGEPRHGLLPYQTSPGTGRWSSALLTNRLWCQALPLILKPVPSIVCESLMSVFTSKELFTCFTTCMLKTTVALQLSLLFSPLMWISVRSMQFSFPFCMENKFTHPKRVYSVFSMQCLQHIYLSCLLQLLVSFCFVTWIVPYVFMSRTQRSGGDFEGWKDPWTRQ